MTTKSTTRYTRTKRAYNALYKLTIDNGIVKPLAQFQNTAERLRPFDELLDMLESGEWYLLIRRRVIDLDPEKEIVITTKYTRTEDTK